MSLNIGSRPTYAGINEAVDRGSIVTGRLYTTKKDRDGNAEFNSWSFKIIKTSEHPDNLDRARLLTKGSRIKILNAVLEQRKDTKDPSSGRIFYDLTIFNFDVLEHREKKTEPEAEVDTPAEDSDEEPL